MRICAISQNDNLVAAAAVESECDPHFSEKNEKKKCICLVLSNFYNPGEGSEDFFSITHGRFTRRVIFIKDKVNRNSYRSVLDMF